MSNVLKPVARRVFPVIIAIDTSGRMAGTKIATVNVCMKKIIDKLKKESEDWQDMDLKIGILKYSDDAEWITGDRLVSVNDFCWKDVEAGGLSNLGTAINEIESKLSRKEYLVSETGFYPPAIIFVGDGCSTDDWQTALKNANDNIWFKNARKFVITVGDDVDTDAFKRITYPEAIIKSDEIDSLPFLISSVSLDIPSHRDILAPERETDIVTVDSNCLNSDSDNDSDNWDADAWNDDVWN